MQRLSTITLVICVAVTSALPSLAENTAPKRVLILYSFGQQFEPFRSPASVFRTELALQSPDPIEFYEASLETARFAEGDIDRPQADYLRALHANTPMDLVVTVGAPAFRFAERHHAQLFPDVPLLVSVTDRRHLIDADLGSNATHVTVNIDLMAFMEDMLRLLPETKTVAVVFGGTPLDAKWIAESRRVWQVFADRVEFQWLNDLSLTEMQDRVASMAPNSAIAFMLMGVDAAGLPYEQHVALELLHGAANAPIFGVFGWELGHGIVGGRLLDGGALGRETAHSAVQILATGTAVGVSPVTIPIGTPVFDWRELRRWNIQEKELPAGSEVRFREPTLWDAYKWPIVTAVVLFALGAVLIVMLLLNRIHLRSTRARLLENDRAMRLASRAARLAIWELDLARDRLWITEEGRELFGWDAKEPLNLQRFIATLRPEDREAARQGLQRAINGGGDFEAEHRITIVGDDGERWIATRGSVEFGPVREPVRVRGVSMDITERKQALLEAQELREELSHSGRVTLLGQFTASLTHELGQPLGAILRNADAAELLLKGEATDVGEVGEILTDVRTDSQRAAAVIKRLRGLLERHNVEMQSLDWNKVMDEVRAIVGGEAYARGVTLEFNASPDLPAVRGDRIHLQQVLLNLVVNAMDALAAGHSDDGRVTVQAHRRNGEWLECAVSDTGTGIAQNELKTMFDPFFTTKANGMGMGLPISRSIVGAHGGRIWAENNSEGGLTIRFTVATDKTGESDD
jgi:C4-dicarboxylate-specific signal transduction histidine kinase